MICLDARHAKKALDMKVNKTDANDAEGLAHLVRATAVAYVAALEKPDTFKRSRAVGAWLGLTPRRFQSGEVDYDGHISRRGDGQLRAPLRSRRCALDAGP
jgi:transposase